MEHRFLPSQEKLWRVACTFKDCLYYRENERSDKLTLCSHPDKGKNKNKLRCPLYRLDWEKKAAMFDV